MTGRYLPNDHDEDDDSDNDHANDDDDESNDENSSNEPDDDIHHLPTNAYPFHELDWQQHVGDDVPPVPPTRFDSLPASMVSISSLMCASLVHSKNRLLIGRVFVLSLKTGSPK